MTLFAAHAGGPSDSEVRAIHAARAKALEARGDSAAAAEARTRASQPSEFSRTTRDELLRARNIARAHGARSK